MYLCFFSYLAMALVLWLFLLLVSLYHILVTVFVYGTGLLQPEMLVIVRDGIWFLLLLVVWVTHRKQIGAYLKRTRSLWIVFFLLCIVGIIVSIVAGKTTSDIMVGMKYGLQFFGIFLTAIFVGHVLAKWSPDKMRKLLRGIFVLFLTILGVGLLWQIAKICWPDLFYQIGYAPLGDWVFGKNPPLYYLTWPGGYPRLSWIFSGPNNYWYLLVGLFGFWWRYIRSYVKSNFIKTVLWLLFAFSLLWTMSRGAILGVFLQLIALSFVLFHAKRKYIWTLIITGVVVVWALSILKWGSTMAHVTAKFSSLQYVRANPLGYGLGSSGPSIHTWHGSILPENFFVQILIDIGIPGLLLWLLFRYFTMRNIRRISKHEDKKSPYNVLLICLSFGFLGLMLEWMFLHVFEDSMVNYWFFVLWGIVYGYVLSHKSHNGQ